MKYKFKRGDRVEVLVKKELPCCTWRCGEIVSGNGHHYDISFYDSLGRGGGRAGGVFTSMPLVERVPRKLMRPFPPRVDGAASRDWAPGDTAEMFDNMSWKAVSVTDEMGGDYYLVRLLGSVHEVRVHKSSLRVQQIWMRDEWIMLGNQKSRGNGDGFCGKRKLRQEEEEDDGVSDTESVCSNSITVTSKTPPYVSLSDSDSRYFTDDAESRFGWEYDMRPPLRSKEAVAVGLTC